MLRRRSAFLAALVAAACLAGPASAADAPADPVVARVDGQELHKSDVESMLRGLPAQVRQLPFDQVYPMLLEQMVSGMLLAEEGRKQKLGDDPKVKERIARLADRVIQEAYIDRVVAAAATDEALKARYEADLKSNPPKEEVAAHHILVASEGEAKQVIQQLEKGADFEKLAKEKSTDPGKENGGDLGFFSREEMVPEFADAAFKLKKGEFTKTPVKSQFGWHVIRVDDRRTQAAPSFEESKEQLTGELAREVIGDKLKQLRAAAKIETFGLDGQPLAKE